MSTDNYPMITVVMPNYNGARFIEQSIDSVLAQTYSNYEFIIVDDCSTDNSPELILRKASEDSRIRVIEKDDNTGVADTRNIGIRKARGSYIALIDSDDLWTPDKLERQLALSEKSDIVYCSYDFIDEENNTVKKPFIVPEKTTFKRMLSSNEIGCSTSFVKAKLMKEHPFNPDYYHEDYVLWMELLKECECAYGDPEVLVHYRIVKGSRSDNKRNAAKERWTAYRKALNLSIPASASAFVRYAVNGIIKHHF